MAECLPECPECGDPVVGFTSWSGTGGCGISYHHDLLARVVMVRDTAEQLEWLKEQIGPRLGKKSGQMQQEVMEALWNAEHD